MGHFAIINFFLFGIRQYLPIGRPTIPYMFDFIRAWNTELWASVTGGRWAIAGFLLPWERSKLFVSGRVWCPFFKNHKMGCRFVPVSVARARRAHCLA
jgi:hypothetical protein